jgi:F0F1-type ATP synthase membrane subunit c/vacuolar-type H+-ATPase subunit K
MDIDLAKKYQTMVTLWAALLMSVVLYFVVTVFAAPPIAESDSPPSKLLLIGVAALGTFLVGVSFVVKRKFLSQAVEQQDVGLVQKAMVFACALCEATALLGVLSRFLMNNRHHAFLFLLAAAGQVLHFPRRDDLEAARWKPLPGSTSPE